VLQTAQSAAGTLLRTTAATYTLTGNTASATDANGNLTRYAYDFAPLVVKRELVAPQHRADRQHLDA
jgi:uncharacterized protein RhaS with RHS repeats